MWNSLATIVGSGFDGSGYLRSINSPVSIAILVLGGGASANPTVDGSMQWRTGDDALVMGSGTESLYASLGVWKTFTPTLTGFAAASPASIVGRYATLGKTCIYNVYSRKVGVSSTTGFTVTLPINSANLVNHYLGYGQGTDNTVYQNNILADIDPNSPTVVALTTQGGSAGWTASGAKDASFTVIYETA